MYSHTFNYLNINDINNIIFLDKFTYAYEYSLIPYIRETFTEPLSPQVPATPP